MMVGGRGILCAFCAQISSDQTLMWRRRRKLFLCHGGFTVNLVSIAKRKIMMKKMPLIVKLRTGTVRTSELSTGHVTF